jgi:hypothetical protein
MPTLPVLLTVYEVLLLRLRHTYRDWCYINRVQCSGEEPCDLNLFMLRTALVIPIRQTRKANFWLRFELKTSWIRNTIPTLSAAAENKTDERQCLNTCHLALHVINEYVYSWRHKKERSWSDLNLWDLLDFVRIVFAVEGKVLGKL